MESVLPAAFAVSAVLYIGLGVFVSRSSPYSVIGYFLFLIGSLVAGSALSLGSSDPALYGIGRALSIVAGGFLPVAFYSIYRQYTDSVPGMTMLAILSIIPATSTVLALTNPIHHLAWTSADAGIGMFHFADNYWFSQVHKPFTYGLFAYSVTALVSRIPSIAAAHRKTVATLAACVVVPFLVGIAGNFYAVAPAGFPFLPLTLTLLLPVYAYASVSLRVYEFNPIAYQTLFNHVQDPIIVLDNDQRVICVNRKATELLRACEADLMGRRLWEDFPEARDALKKARELKLTQTLEMSAEQTYEITVEPMLNKRGRPQGSVVVCRDVTKRRKALARLADSEHLIRTLIETSSNGILRFARDHNDERLPFRCVFANRAAESYLNSDGGALVGMPLEKISPLDPDRVLASFGEHAGQDAPLTFEVENEASRDNSWLRVVCEPVGADISITLIDITQRKHNEHKMLADALRDPLTGVLNRRGFEREAASSIRGNKDGAVMYLDLNHFKVINDRFGHQAGDALLKAFGHRLEFCLRPEDILGRLGGDEFAIVLPAVSVEDAKHVAARLVDAASEAYIIQGQEIRCGVSVGIAIMPRHGEELWHLISVADDAMYNAKAIAASDAANDHAAYIEAAIAS